MNIFRLVGRTIGRATQDVVIGFREGVRKANQPKPMKHPYKEAMSLEELQQV